jgi:predicted transcriptional regulator
MSQNTLRTEIKFLLQNSQFVTHTDVAKKISKDKAKVSGYLEAMVDYGELQVKRVGNSKVYYLGNRKDGRTG